MNYDQDQLTAIKSLDNTLVIAGAGSGKTTTIVGKVDYLIENNLYKENEILIISFTNETVNSLKKKIKHNISVKTFHKLALYIINQNNMKISISNDKYLNYIIDEYLNSYAIYNKKTNILYKRVLSNKTIYQLKKLISTFINIYKCNYNDINKLFELYNKSLFLNKIYYKLILDIYLIYQRELESTESLDLNDIIIKASQLIKNNHRKTLYKYIIVDEFQDSSEIRFNLIMNIIKKNSGKIFVVGDDYQSIYRFSGCNLSLFLNFTKYLPETKIIYLNNNYRNSQELINVANKFILKNTNQFKKNTICHKSIDRPIKIVFYVDKSKVFNKIKDISKDKTLILGRNNSDKEKFKIIDDDNYRFLTIHKSKGLEENNIVLINLENSNTGFPSKIKNDRIISNILTTDYIIYEEERRLFYVALTRAKNYVYLLVPKYNYSVFIRELLKDYKNLLDIIHID